MKPARVKDLPQWLAWARRQYMKWQAVRIVENAGDNGPCPKDVKPPPPPPPQKKRAIEEDRAATSRGD